MSASKIGIIGLGLIGGSIAKAIRHSHPSATLYAIDTDKAMLIEASDEGIINFSSSDDFSIFQSCEVIFLCAPVKASIAYLDRLADIVQEDTIVTDVCSTKNEILIAASSYENISFIGGHPMAGSEKSGYKYSSPHLFENAYYVLCPGKKLRAEQYDLLKDLVKSFGAIPVKMDSEVHDYVTGSISHLPHVVASCLVNFISSKDTEENSMKALAAGGFRDITRIASSSPVMWQHICLSNKESITGILDSFIEELSAFKNSLNMGNSDYIYNFFNKAKEYRDSMPVKNNSIIPVYFELIADIPDKPGMLGEVATLLGKEDINIKNMNISNSREMEGGCLTVSFPDAVSRDIAIQILTKSGIRCYSK